jgi:hypothetical protein
MMPPQSLSRLLQPYKHFVRAASSIGMQPASRHTISLLEIATLVNNGRHAHVVVFTQCLACDELGSLFHRHLGGRLGRIDALETLLTGQWLLIFIQLVWSLRIWARILESRFASRSRRERVSPFGSERRNTSMRFCATSKESMSPS